VTSEITVYSIYDRERQSFSIRAIVQSQLAQDSFFNF